MSSLNISFEEKDYSAFSIVYCLERFCSLTGKLLLLDKIAIMLSENINPRYIYLLPHSKDIWEKDYLTIDDTNFQWSVPLSAVKGTPNKPFFDLLKKLKRPVLYNLVKDEYIPVLDLSTPNVFKIRSIIFNSPGDINIDLGVGDFLTKVFTLKKDEKRKQEIHELQKEDMMLDIEYKQMRNEYFKRLLTNKPAYVNYINQDIETNVQKIHQLRTNFGIKQIDIKA